MAVLMHHCQHQRAVSSHHCRRSCGKGECHVVGVRELSQGMRTTMASMVGVLGKGKNRDKMCLRRRVRGFSKGKIVESEMEW